MFFEPEQFQSQLCFGRVIQEKGPTGRSPETLDKACQLVDDEYQKVAQLADTAAAYSVKANLTSPDNPEARAGFFAQAKSHYEQGN